MPHGSRSKKSVLPRQRVNLKLSRVSWLPRKPTLPSGNKRQRRHNHCSASHRDAYARQTRMTENERKRGVRKRPKWVVHCRDSRVAVLLVVSDLLVAAVRRVEHPLANKSRSNQSKQIARVPVDEMSVMRVTTKKRKRRSASPRKRKRARRLVVYNEVTIHSTILPIPSIHAYVPSLLPCDPPT